MTSPVKAVPRWSRPLSALIALGSGVVLGLAAWLEPAAAGHGTHLQLGLGQCTVLTLTGYPCPMCGATTTFALLAEGRLWTAVLNQPFASLLFFLTLGAHGVAVAELILPRDRWNRILDWIEPREMALLIAFSATMAGSWAYKAWLMGAVGGG